MNATLDLLLRIEEMESSEEIVSEAKLAEELGFRRVSMGETTNWNIVPLMGVIASETETLGISNDVISPFGRSPALLAQTALTLHDISNGRYRLGLGPSSPALTENWHGTEFDRPLRRLRETIEIINRIYDEGTPTYDGDIFEIQGLQYGLEVPETPPPIDVAALGPKVTELTGRFADGWIPQLLTKSGLEDRLKALRRGTELGDRDPEELRVSPILRCFASEDREDARERARSAIAFQLGVYGPYYGDSVADQGYSDVVEEIRDAWSDRDKEAMTAALPDEVLDELVAVGTPTEVRERVERYGDTDGVDAVRVGFINTMSADEKEETMRVIADLK